MATRVPTITPRERKSLTAQKTWKALEDHYKKIHREHLRTLFEKDPWRGEQLTAEAIGIFLDYSKNRITARRCGC